MVGEQGAGQLGFGFCEADSDDSTDVGVLLDIVLAVKNALLIPGGEGRCDAEFAPGLAEPNGIAVAIDDHHPAIVDAQ